MLKDSKYSSPTNYGGHGMFVRNDEITIVVHHLGSENDPIPGDMDD